MFQLFLPVPAPSFRLYAGLWPHGRMSDPWDVICSACPFRATAPNHLAAVRVAYAHDREHWNNERRTP